MIPVDHYDLSIAVPVKDRMSLEHYFEKFRINTVGYNHRYTTPYGEKIMLYADWIGSGRLYHPIENTMLNSLGPFIGNTHTETSENGRLMTQAYELAHQKIKNHVNAGSSDVILTTGYGMTGAIVKFQRILGMKSCGEISHHACIKESERPVVFVTHMEHHSNQTTWYETSADVVVIEPGKDLLVDPVKLEEALQKYKDRKPKIGSFTACSNVTGIRTPYHQMARIMHEHGGVAFIDFAASAPYDEINMHPADPLEKLDAIFFSPHKFLGGPGSSGVLIFDSSLYNNKTPDQPGGGTVDWTNPWGEYKFIDNIEIREDGGTPGFLQAIRTALALELKSQMGVEKMHRREKKLIACAFAGMRKIQGLHILADPIEDRLGVISFYLDSIHYNLVVRLLSDRFGIQVRGGCVCAGTYGHYLLNVSHEKSKAITDKIDRGDLSEKPGWVRLSIHPTMKDQELDYILDAVQQIRQNHQRWSMDYSYDRNTNEFHYSGDFKDILIVDPWFTLE
ncbi:MAG: aminotransferase class V-fold PLP-dependent enzyme [Bacteroidetes bacterium]|nr:aminotransferase class V-fold PLP-dependent enzyme [Bacteroidota bacterium]